MKKNRLVLFLFLLLAGVAAWFLLTKKSSTLNPALKDFAVKDTAAIDKIFMADRKGNQVVLTREANGGGWLVNGKFRARSSNINTLLYTIMALEVRSPVGKNLYNNTMSLMASTSVKTEIYQHGQLVKTYYVGHPTMDSQGTFMYLEGSSVPFIMYIPGFQGYLTTRYFAETAEWKDPAIFRYTPGSFKSLKVEDMARPARSFTLDITTDTTVKIVQTASGKEVLPVDKMKVRSYLAGYQATSYEKPDHNLKKSQHDSLLLAGPFARVTVHETSGKDFQIRCYRMPLGDYSKFTSNGSEENYPFDYDKFVLQMDGDTSWYICQYYHFDRILKDPQNFTPGRDKTPAQSRF